MFNNKRILVTGGTGSIGSELVRKLIPHNPETIRVFSIDEASQFHLKQELSEYNNVRYLIGDIRDKDRLRRAVEDIDIIFHAAALKHVSSCEYNPFEAVKTNVIGTQNLIDVALEENVEKLIAISTDKAAGPTNTMGASKLLAEKLIAGAHYHKGKKRTIFSCVRFGNVLNSRGSVVPLFIEQAKSNKPITVTDPNMTRFMMTIDQAVELIFESAKIAQGGEIFILKMPALRLGDLADVIKQELNPIMETKIIGVRPGERIHEDLITEDESKIALETEKMFIIPPNLTTTRQTSPVRKYSSSTQTLLTKQQIREILKQDGVF